MGRGHAWSVTLARPANIAEVVAQTEQDAGLNLHLHVVDVDAGSQQPGAVLDHAVEVAGLSLGERPDVRGPAMVGRS